MQNKYRTLDCDGCKHCLPDLDGNDNQVCYWGVEPKKLVDISQYNMQRGTQYRHKMRHCSLINDPPREKKLGTWTL